MADVLQALREQGLNVGIDAALLERTPTITCHLEGAKRETALEALAHASDSWWIDGNDGAVITRSPRLPQERRRLDVCILECPNIDPRLAEPLVQRFLDPWLDPAWGSVGFDPATRRASITAAPEGRERFKEIITVLDHPVPRVPPVLGTLTAPQPVKVLNTTISGGSRRSLVVGLARSAGISCSLGPGVSILDRAKPLGNTSLAVKDLAQALIELERLGLTWAWRRNVLCVGIQPIMDHLHPALQVRLAVFCIDHLRLKPEIVKERLKTNPDLWTQPGWLLEVHQGWLYVAAAEDSIRIVLTTLEGLEQADH
jgi:hypothetical protein